MTFSVVGRCARSGQLGVGAVTGTPGVGQLVTWARARVGAVATQSWVNPYLGIDALALLASGHPADKALSAVVALDEDAGLRQVGVVDADGGSAAFTGPRCSPVATHQNGAGWSVQGNLLEDDVTIERCVAAYVDHADDELVVRLLSALQAGEEAGGDRRGARSAAIYVVASEYYPLWDLRVDDNDRPLEELAKLHHSFSRTILPQIRRLPTRAEPRGQLRGDDNAGLV